MTTNREWLEGLAKDSPDELAAWFDAERDEPGLPPDGYRDALEQQRAATANANDLWGRTRDALAAVKAERDALADDLMACNREREHLRRTLGIALDHAHDVLALVDADWGR